MRINQVIQNIVYGYQTISGYKINVWKIPDLLFLRVCKHRKNSLCGSYERHDYTKKEKLKVNKSSWVTHLASHHYNKQNRNKTKKITALSIGYYSITRRIQLPNILKANSTFFFFFFKVFFISKHCRSLSPQVTENGVYQMQRLYTILKEHGGKLIAFVLVSGSYGARRTIYEVKFNKTEERRKTRTILRNLHGILTQEPKWVKVVIPRSFPGIPRKCFVSSAMALC